MTGFRFMMFSSTSANVVHRVCSLFTLTSRRQGVAFFRAFSRLQQTRFWQAHLYMHTPVLY